MEKKSFFNNTLQIWIWSELHRAFQIKVLQKLGGIFHLEKFRKAENRKFFSLRTTELIAIPTNYNIS